MVLDKRRAHLLSIIQQSHTPIPTKELVKKMRVSQRTIYYDLHQINNWLENQNLEPVQNIRGKGLYLPGSTSAKVEGHHHDGFDGWQYQLSKQERELLIKAIILLEEQNASMDRFMETTGMSRGTVAEALKSIKQEFKSNDLNLQYKPGSGYMLDGPEETKRRMVSDVLTTVLSHKEWPFLRNEVLRMIQAEDGGLEQDKRGSVKTLLYEAEKELGLTLTDEMVEVLSLQIFIMLKRIHQQRLVTVDLEEKNVLQQTEAYHAALRIAKKLGAMWEVQLPEDEVCFITMNLLGSKVHHDDFSRYAQSELIGLKKVVHRMVSDFQTYACVIFDDRKGLEENLISHIKPTYYRLKYGVKIGNELSQSIQENYQDIYHLTKRVMLHLEYYVGEPIPDEEIAYITLHFGGWLTKEKKQVETKYRAIIVCENGIGTSNMLKAQLENLITGLEVIETLSMREFQAKDFDVDVIFSTNFIKPRIIPVIHVPAILSTIEKEYVFQRMNELFGQDARVKDLPDRVLEVVEKYATVNGKEELKREISALLETKSPKTKELRKPMLNELLTEETIQLEDHVADWEESIRLAAQPLVDLDSIRTGYVDAMIENVKELGPYIVIAPRIAIPHARPEAGVERLGMSLLRLKEPVHFSSQTKHQAQLIIVLAAIDNQTHLTALAQLTELLSNEQNVDRLILSEDRKSVVELINQAITA
ncbi:BglG family transcription antiterminator [Pseudalkalibacillus salsuginis]|uniref:BglG family transcription antiterminator n=1 Tax=Pseudalkalibacillus salsuginis TaxID=2910972 RepID=UPI001F47D76F|nr:BglG family transcription antiterminator [Pseudalkalibacillus salsuginis]MCF6409503.1 BglG family transcription antiterminator [Pseudalkalibacillus salsuginis]